MFNRSKKKYINLILTNREWELAKFLLYFLSPFKIITNLLQATQKPTLHKTFEIYERLFNSIDNVRTLFQNMNIKPDWISQIENAIDQIWNKFKEYYTDTNISFMYGDAMILYSSLKMSWFKKQG